MITQVERTFEGVLVTFQADRVVTVLFSVDDAIQFASTVMGVAALGAIPDPAELITDGRWAARWAVTYRCGCTDHRPSNDTFRDACPEHGAEQEAPPHLEAA